ncbi:hypothetical protein [Streptomyces sp. NPDC050704]|uniref:hypothetical protein n=1 Tax=Streptomyces sp. NPDC050704 TaxID=3157219 RepID=UPI00343B96AE
MRTLSRYVIPLLAAGCLAVTAATPASATDAGRGAAAAPTPVPAPAPGPCNVDWPKLAGLTGPASLHEAIVACAESYTEADLDSWLKPPPKLSQAQVTDTGTGTTPGTGTAAEEAEDWTGADADWDADLLDRVTHNLLDK